MLSNNEHQSSDKRRQSRILMNDHDQGGQMVMYSEIYEFRARAKNHDKSRQTNVEFRGFLEFREFVFFRTRTSAIAEGPRDALRQLKCYELLYAQLYKNPI